MSPKDFWRSLEYRLCHEFKGMPLRWQRALCCDGFLPQVYFLDDPDPRITGIVWIYGGLGRSDWEFTLILPRKFSSCDEIDWVSLLPPNDATRWLAVDMQRRKIEIEPAVAVPDLVSPVVEPSRLPRWSP